MRNLLLFATVFGLSTSLAYAEVTRFDVARRERVGTSEYEIVGTVHFAVDPGDPHNRVIADLERAPIGASNRVEFSADLYILRPIDPTHSNGVALVFTLSRSAASFAVADLAGYSPVDPSGPDTVLTVRDGPFERAETVARNRWQLDGQLISLDRGLEAGRTYEVAYRAANPAVAGTGLAAIRDVISWLKYSPTTPSRVRYALGYGASLSDIEPPQNVRIYLSASTQHLEAQFPPRITAGQQADNTLGGGALRGLFIALDARVRNETEPPPSRYPRRAANTTPASRSVGTPGPRGRQRGRRGASVLRACRPLSRGYDRFEAHELTRHHGDEI